MKPLSPKAVSHYSETKDVCAHSAVFKEETRFSARSRLNTFKHPFVEGKMMIHLKPITRKVIAGLSTLAISAAGLMAGATAAQATDGQVTIDYTSSARADYSYLHGTSTVDWAPWGDSKDAPGVDWAANQDWTHNFKVADGVLKVQKAQAGCATAGILVASLSADQSVISIGHNSVTVDVTAADAGVKYSAVATDSNDGNSITATAIATDAAASLTFTFSPTDGVAYSKLTLVPDNDLAIAGNNHEDWGCGTFSATASKLYTFDNLSYYLSGQSAPAPRAANSTKLTFETGDALGAAGVTQGFAGAAGAIVDKPAGWNSAAMSIVKSGDPWGGFNMLLHPNSTDKYTDATHKVASLNFYSPIDAAVPVVLELDPGQVQVQVMAHKGWQKLTFDFGGTVINGTWSENVDYTTVVLFPNFQVPAVLTDTYYVDNISLNGASAPVLAQNPTVQAATATASSATSATKSLSFTVKTFAGVVVSGATVTFATNNKGTLNHASAVTNADGVATVVASATGAGTQVVVASYEDGNGGSGIASSTITWSLPTNPTVQAAVATASSATSATKSLSFTVKNYAGDVVSGATVSFTTNNKGTLNHASAVTNSMGVATVVASATAAGSQVVTAAYNDGMGGTASATSTITWSVNQPPVVAKKVVAISIKNRVVTVSVTNGKGAKVTVTANGGYQLVFTPSSAAKTSKTLTFKKKGTYTVTVVTSGSSTITKKYVVK